MRQTAVRLADGPAYLPDGQAPGRASTRGSVMGRNHRKEPSNNSCDRLRTQRSVKLVATIEAGCRGLWKRRPGHDPIKTDRIRPRVGVAPIEWHGGRIGCK